MGKLIRKLVFNKDFFLLLFLDIAKLFFVTILLTHETATHVCYLDLEHVFIELTMSFQEQTIALKSGIIILASCHPVFWKFLSVLKNEENLTRVSITQHLAGH